MAPQPGVLVLLLDDGRIGKLQSANDGAAVVEFFLSPSERLRKTVPLARVKPIQPQKDQRCYAYDAVHDAWRIGRFRERYLGPDGRARFQFKTSAGEPHQDWAEADVFVRAAGAAGDPAELLAERCLETPFFLWARHELVRALLAHRAAARRLDGLLSAHVQLLPHQVEIVRRVLEDPVQRYLLADEVGLGKTIEAGIIVRQVLLDDPEARVAVAAPRPLLSQWREELASKFLLAAGERLCLVAHDELGGLTAEGWSLLVLDEAHLVAVGVGEVGVTATYEACRRLASATPGLLLLSATPALHHEREFLAMLHLLEPTVYQLDDIAGLQGRLAARQELGAAMVSLRSSVPFVLGVAVATVRAVCGDDATALSLADGLQAAVEDPNADGAAAKLSSAAWRLRQHLGEVHRLHRRLLRWPRNRAVEALQTARAADPSAPPVQLECADDHRYQGVCYALDNWRGHVADQAYGNDAQLHGLAEVLALLVTAQAASLAWLRDQVACRRAGAGAFGTWYEKLSIEEEQVLLAAPPVDGEDAYLGALLTALDQPADDAFDADQLLAGLVTMRAGMPNQPQRLVVFVSSSMVAARVWRHLKTELTSAVTVVRHLATDDDAARVASVQALEEATGTVVLVCDQSAEHGLNLQTASLLVHLDLPWNPNQLEQRIGRLDRIGRTGEVVQRVMLSGDSDGDAAAEIDLPAAWYQVLCDCFGVFGQSIAGLQVVVDQLMPRLRRLALEQGAAGLRDAVPDLKAQIEQERARLDEQWALDEMEVGDRGFAAELLAQDRAEADWQAAVEGWVVNALRVDRREVEPGGLRYSIGRNAVIENSSLRPLVEALGDVAHTYSRATACSMADRLLLRRGHPFITALDDMVSQDERGRVFALWRRLTSWRHPPTCFYRFDLRVEADLEAALAVLQPDNAGAAGRRVARSALRRRADGWLPPSIETAYMHGRQLVENAALLRYLNCPYLSREHDGSDVSLRVERLSCLGPLVPHAEWGPRCRRARGDAEQLLRGKLGAVWQEAAKRAAAELDTWSTQASRGLQVRFVGSAIPSACSDQLERQRAALAALVEGVRSPRLSLDAAGLVVLAAEWPELPGDGDA